jgi:hypothetical protein
LIIIKSRENKKQYIAATTFQETLSLGIRQATSMQVSEVELQTHLEHTLACKSRLTHVVGVTESFDGRIAWDGTVCVFELLDHPTAALGYAWSSIDSQRPRFHAVLGIPPIN